MVYLEMANNYKHTIIQAALVLCNINYEGIVSEQSSFVIFSLRQ